MSLTAMGDINSCAPPLSASSTTSPPPLTILESMRLDTISGMLPASGSPSVAAFAYGEKKEQKQ